MATTLGQAPASSIATSHEYAGKERDTRQLSKGELPSFTGEQPDERSFWELLEDLEDKDDTVDSKEHMVLLGCLGNAL